MKQLIDIDRAKQLAMAVSRIFCSLFPSAVARSSNQKRDNSATAHLFVLRYLSISCFPCMHEGRPQEDACAGRTGKNRKEQNE